jgi:hypothetical protein
MKNTTQNTPKLPYEAPMLTDVGTGVERTLGSSDGSTLDASFPVGTPEEDLTFS